MGWQAYCVEFRLRSPMHIGRGNVGNVQLAYPYVTGRTLWGALTARLTRDGYQGNRTSPSAAEYEEMGDRVNGRDLAFSYLFPALEKDGNFEPWWPWEAESTFRYRFFSTYVSTALNYAANSAEEGSLHEVEFLAPYTRDGKPVYLKGYIFARNGGVPGWQEALTRLQIGGERGYGWGRLERVACDEQKGPEVRLFGKSGYKAHVDGDVITVTVPAQERLLAHTLPHSKIKAEGTIEPLLGRMWSPSQCGRSEGFGQYISNAQVCWPPGSLVTADATIQIGPYYGIWEAV